jgi:hypothetical protein
MKYILGFFKFWYHFIVGDDWRIAAGVVLGLCLVALLAHTHATIWWVLPLLVVTMLSLSLWLTTRRH